ncbi:MAG UNVERIFIED_CONTAM: hypothetical protein LVR18_38390 [Planctomycetaceae bacterium]
MSGVIQPDSASAKNACATNRRLIIPQQALQITSLSNSSQSLPASVEDHAVRFSHQHVQQPAQRLTVTHLLHCQHGRQTLPSIAARQQAAHNLRQSPPADAINSSASNLTIRQNSHALPPQTRTPARRRKLPLKPRIAGITR